MTEETLRHRPSDVFSFKCILVIGAVLFGIAHSQHPVYSSNQNTYFFHGLERVGVGLLNEDILALSPDSTPVFSLLVYATERWGSATFYYIYYLLVLAMFGCSVFGIARMTLRTSDIPIQWWMLGTSLVVIHSYLFHKLLWPMQSGVAGQYVLGKVFQPSVFGVFLLFSVLHFLQEKRIAACITAAVAVLIHPTYAICAGSLVASYVVLSWPQRQSRIRIAIGLCVFLLLTIPLVAFLWSVFQPSNAQVMTEAARILVNERIPHHAVPSHWFGFGTVLRLAIVLWGMWLVRRNPLGTIMAVLLAVGGVLTVAQIATDDARLALLFPWRVSVILVPMGTAILMARLAETLAHRYQESGWGFSISRWCTSMVFVLSLIGAGRFVYLAWMKNNPRDTLYQEVRKTSASGNKYLIPPQWDDFRLATDAPAYVDRKSHPYRDLEVLAWYHRLSAAERFFTKHDCGLLDSLAQFGDVTHVVLDTNQPDMICPQLEFEWTDGHYSIARLPRTNNH